MWRITSIKSLGEYIKEKSSLTGLNSIGEYARSISVLQNDPIVNEIVNTTVVNNMVITESILNAFTSHSVRLDNKPLHSVRINKCNRVEMIKQDNTMEISSNENIKLQTR